MLPGAGIAVEAEIRGTDDAAAAAVHCGRHVLQVFSWRF
jgi:hypothetical protein